MPNRNDDNPSAYDDRGRGGADDPINHDLGDDRGGDRPAGSGSDDPATHDLGDDKGGLRAPGTSDDNPLTHDVGDDHGGERLQLVQNGRTGQWIFTDDLTEHQHWLDDHGHHGGEVRVAAAAADDRVVPVYRFHDPVSDVYFWTSDDALRGALVGSHPELEFDGEVFKAFADDRGGAHQAIGVVWDQHAGPYGNFVYLPADDAVKLAGLSDSDDMVYLGVSFYI